MLQAANLMLENHVSGLPVLDETGAVVGIVSEGDFLRRSEMGTSRKRNRLLSFIFGHGREAEDYVLEHGRRVSEVMTPSPITIGEDASLSEVVSVMERNKIKRVPVVRHGKLVEMFPGPICYRLWQALPMTFPISRLTTTISGNVSSRRLKSTTGIRSA